MFRTIYRSRGHSNTPAQDEQQTNARPFFQKNSIANAVQRQPSADAQAESQVENDRESFSIILARHYLATQNNEGLACGFSYSIDDKSNITFTLIKCWKIFDI